MIQISVQLTSQAGLAHVLSYPMFAGTHFTYPQRDGGLSQTLAMLRQEWVLNLAHVTSQSAALQTELSWPRDAMVIPVPKGEYEPSSDNEDIEQEEAIVAMMPCSWQNYYRSYKHFNELCQQGDFLQYGDCMDVVRGIVVQWKTPLVRVKSSMKNPEVCCQMLKLGMWIPS